MLEDCPICKWLKEKKIEKRGNHCSLIKMGASRVVVLNEHSENSTPESLAEAFGFLDYNKQGGFISEYRVSPGHWAIKVAVPNGLPDGQSAGRSE